MDSLAFHAKKEIFRAISMLMISADLNIAKTLIGDFDFMSLMTSLIEVMYNYIPFEIVDALLIVQRFYELGETEWNQFIWDNEEIVD